MNTRPMNPIEFAAEVDAAKARAHALREEAIRAGWNALGHALLRMWHGARYWKRQRHAATIGRWVHPHSHSSKARSVTAPSCGASAG